jgi:UDP-N-acetylglucosamine diphosphorylase/glucosamine-1-phosphate N-acetyltransferase
MRICIFEDSSTVNLSPLNYFRHTSELICGALTLAEKIEFYTSNKYKISLHCRKYLQAYLEEKFPRTDVNSLQNDDYLFLNSRAIYTQGYVEKLFRLTKKNKNVLHSTDNEVIAFHVSSGSLSAVKTLVERPSEDNTLRSDSLLNLGLSKLNIDEPELQIINYPWDLIGYHDSEMKRDLKILFKNKKKASISKKLSNVVLDNSEGTILLSSSVRVEPFVYIRGPAFIGGNTVLKSGTKIYGPVTIRDNARVSGEISHSIFHPFVNKQHLGFVGHSYLCEWVNLGAGTITSNLKNNYSPISVKLDSGQVNTCSNFLGSIIGDHTKTGISTMLNTGSIIGVSSNLFGGAYMPKLVRSFSWLDADSRNTYLYEIEKALSTAKISMQRRNINMTGSYEELFKLIFKRTRENLI